MRVWANMFVLMVWYHSSTLIIHRYDFYFTFAVYCSFPILTPAVTPPPLCFINRTRADVMLSRDVTDYVKIVCRSLDWNKLNGIGWLMSWWPLGRGWSRGRAFFHPSSHVVDAGGVGRAGGPDMLWAVVAGNLQTGSLLVIPVHID